jgi:polyisoprenoid-binding protein YceI
MYKVIITLILSLSFSTLFAQSYAVNPEKSEVIITGTSNVHDWESKAEQFTGTATIDVQNDSLISISDLKFEVVVDGIKSGKGGMDKKTYDALNKKKYPNITFALLQVSELTAHTLAATGELTISGETRSIQMDVEYRLLPDGSIVFKGTQPINMEDYKVSAPTAMFGAIRAGAAVEVTFNATFSN